MHKYKVFIDLEAFVSSILSQRKCSKMQENARAESEASNSDELEEILSECSDFNFGNYKMFLLKQLCVLLIFYLSIQISIFQEFYNRTGRFKCPN